MLKGSIGRNKKGIVAGCGILLLIAAQVATAGELEECKAVCDSAQALCFEQNYFPPDAPGWGEYNASCQQTEGRCEEQCTENERLREAERSEAEKQPKTDGESTGGESKGQAPEPVAAAAEKPE